MTNAAWAFMIIVWAAIFITEGIAMSAIIKSKDKDQQESTSQRIG